MCESILSRKYLLKPSESNAMCELPLTLLVEQCIDLATDHANILGIGFSKLNPLGAGWVLSRISVETKGCPKTGEEYTLNTWVENWNSHFSERCFSIVSNHGILIGYIRTTWVVIDLQTHLSRGTNGMILSKDLIAGIECPIPKFQRPKPFTPQKESAYVFKYTDLDFYKHVNTVRYVSLLINQFSLSQMEAYSVTRMDIAFQHEAKYGEKVKILSTTQQCEAPYMLANQEGHSEKHIFELSISDIPILSAALVLTNRKSGKA